MQRIVQCRSSYRGHFAMLLGALVVYYIPETTYAQIFVSSFEYGTIGAYTTSGALINPYMVEGLAGPQCIAVYDGNVFVTNYNDGTIGKYTTSGLTVNAALVTGLSSPVGIAVSGNSIYVVDTGHNAIGQYDATTGATINAALFFPAPALNQEYC